MTDFPKIPGELLPEKKEITISDLEIGHTVSILILYTGYEVDSDGVLWISKTIPATAVRGDKPHKDVTIRVTRVPEGLSVLVAKGTKFAHLRSREKTHPAPGFLPVIKYEIFCGEGTEYEDQDGGMA